MGTISTTFEIVLALAHGAQSNVPGIKDQEITAIRAELKTKITSLLLNNINVGQDPGRPGPPHARRSLNHTALLFQLATGGQVRLDMQNGSDVKLGQAAPGVYMFKLTAYQGASTASTMITKLPWNSNQGIRTLQELIVSLGHFELHLYSMTPDHHGCRYHARGILSVLVDAGITHLDVENENLGWSEDTKTFGRTPNEVHANRVKISMRRLDTYFSYYFNLQGVAREVSKKEGKFQEALPFGGAFMKFVRYQLADYVSLLEGAEEEPEEELDEEDQVERDEANDDEVKADEGNHDDAEGEEAEEEGGRRA